LAIAAPNPKKDGQRDDGNATDTSYDTTDDGTDDGRGIGALSKADLIRLGPVGISNLDDDIERTQKGASEQILLVVGISPALNVACTGPITQFLDEESLVYLPGPSSDDGREGEFGITRNDVDGGLAIVRWFGG